MAIKYNISVLYGYPELDPDDSRSVYNSTQLVGRTGESLCNYRKVHLWLDEKAIFTAGEELKVIDLDGIKMGILICFDIRFPEAFRIMKRMGAQFVAIPTAIESDCILSADCLPQARAYEQQMYVACINHCGQEKPNCSIFCGHSGLYDPLGVQVVKAGEEECLLTGNINPSGYAKETNLKLDICEEIRPDIYKNYIDK